MPFSDEQILFIVVFFLYVTDCFFWAEKHSFAFILTWGKNWKLVFPSAFFANKRGGLLFINPFNPLSSRVFQCHLFPISFSPTGICAYNSQTLNSIDRPHQTGASLEYKNIYSVKQINKDIYINKALFVKCKIIYHAELIIDVLSRIILLPEDDRGIFIKNQLQRLCQLPKVNEIIGKYKYDSLTLRILCFTWLFFMIIVFPLIVWKYSLLKIVIPIIILTIYFTLVISIEFYRLHKLWYPSDREDRVNTLIKMILCPPSAVSANDKLTLKLVSFYDPLCLGLYFLSKEYFSNFAQRLILDLKYPIKLELSDDISLAINLWHRKNLNEIYNIFLEENFKDTIKFIPNRLDNENKTYCPRCLCQFNLENGECPDCIGIKLVAFNNLS